MDCMDCGGLPSYNLDFKNGVIRKYRFASAEGCFIVEGALILGWAD